MRSDISRPDPLMLFDKLLENNIRHLSKIRIFDILWWSYLKAEKLREEKGINWNTIRFINGN